MTIKRYHIETESFISDYDFGENILNYGVGEYGIQVDFRGCFLIDEEISEALMENNEFIKAAEEEGYNTSFSEMSAYEVYRKLTKQHEDEIFIDHIDGLYEIAISGYYSNLDSQCSKVRNYIEDNDNINVIEKGGYDKFDIDYIIELDDSMLSEVKDFLDKSNEETTKLNEEPSSYEYIEEDFGVPICKANFKNVGSLEVTINEIQ